MRRTAFALLLLVSVTSAHAQVTSAPGDREFDCARPVGTMQTDLCLSDVFADVDQALNVAYRDALSSLTAMRRDGGCSQCAPEQLVEAQRHWIAFRDADCDTLYAIAADGSGRNQARLTCLIDHTRTRSLQLGALDH